MALFVRRRWPKVVAAVGVLAVLVLAVVLLTRDDPSEPTGDLAVVETADPVPDPTLPGTSFDAVIRASDRDLQALVDHEVVATRAPVLSPVGPSAIWVGTSADDRVLVVLVATEKTFEVPAGATVSFTGTVRPSTGAFGRALGLLGKEAADFARQEAYVEITDYTVG